jgi:hypothetical protein
MTHLDLNAEGPHSGDYTRQVAAGLAECVRVLIYATRTTDGVPDPTVVYDVLGSLRDATARMDQLLRQLGDRLSDEHSAGQLWTDHGNPDAVLATTVDGIAAARWWAPRLATDLAQAHSAASHLYTPEQGEGGDAR